MKRLIPIDVDPSFDGDGDGDTIPDLISEAGQALASDISEGLDPDGGEDDPFAGISKILHDTAMAIIRKIGG
jgi:hypothetical protein